VKLVWTDRAKDDLGEIISYIWAENRTAARQMRSRIETLALYLKSQPFMGRAGEIVGTREAIPHRSYRIVYKVGEGSVFILRIIHTSRQWPPVED